MTVRMLMTIYAVAAADVPKDPRTGVVFVSLDGVNATMIPGYEENSNYSLWIELDGRSFDTAWEYHTQRAIIDAIKKS
jgi:hypothetical protein